MRHTAAGEGPATAKHRENLIFTDNQKMEPANFMIPKVLEMAK